MMATKPHFYIDQATIILYEYKNQVAVQINQLVQTMKQLAEQIG